MTATIVAAAQSALAGCQGIERRSSRSGGAAVADHSKSLLGGAPRTARFALDLLPIGLRLRYGSPAMIRRCRASVLAVVAFLLALVPATSNARAQLVSWLRVIPDAKGKPEAVVRMESGTRNARMFWVLPMSRSEFLTLRFVGTRGEQDLLPRLTEKTDRLVVLGAEELNQGPGWVAAEMRPQEREWPADRWRAYLAADGLTFPARLAEQPIRIRIRAFFKAVVIGPKGLSGPALSRSVGLPLEILALSDGVGGELLSVRVLHLGKPLAGVRVTAAALDAAASTSALTDAGGEAKLSLAAPGEWLLRAVVVSPAAAQGFEADAWATKMLFRRQ